MKKFRFDGHKSFSIDLTDRLQIGALSKHRMYDALSDGRVLGLIVEDLMTCEVDGLAKSESARAAHDLFSADLRKIYECKTSKNGAFSVAPSRMKGAGRKFNKEDCLAQILGVDGLILGDTSTFPVIRFAVLRIPEDLDMVSFSKSDAKVSAANWNILAKRK